MYGWKGEILHVDLTNEKIWKEKIDKDVKNYLGGRGIAALIAWKEIPKGVDAYDPENRLIIMTGPLTGTPAPTSGRTIICGVSPRVYPRPWYTHSTMGGYFGPMLKYAGFDGIVVKGAAETPKYLWINDKEVEIISAENLWGWGTRATQRYLKDVYGGEVQIICIGPAGEKKVRYAAICHSKENASGLSGFGAVMGSKKLKAIAVKGTGGIDIADKDSFLEVCKKAMRLSKGSPALDYFIRKRYIKKKYRPVCTQACTLDCLLGNIYRNVPSKFGANYIQSEVLFCIGNHWIYGAEETKYVSDEIAVPAAKSFGVRDGVELHALCDDLGLDLTLILYLQPWLIACKKEGIISLMDVDINPEDPEWFAEFLREMALRKTKLGDLLAEGLRRAVERMKDYLPEKLITLGNVLEFAYGFFAHREGRIWDPEPNPYWIVSAIMYATESRDPTIGSHASYLHLANVYLDNSKKNLEKLKSLARRVWGKEAAVEPGCQYKPEIAIWIQHRHIILDSLPLCDFVFPRIMKPITTDEEWNETEDLYGDINLEAELLTTCTGIKFTTKELEKIGERIFNLERIILAIKFGRDRKIDESIATHFELPCKTDKSRISREEFKKLLDRYYSLRGWDLKTGIPSEDKIRDLNLEEIVDLNRVS